MELIKFCNENFHLVFDMTDRLTDRLYQYEIEVLKHIHNKEYSLILKSRVMNMSSLFSLYLLWFLENNKTDLNVIYFIHKGRGDLNLTNVFMNKGYRESYTKMSCGNNIVKYVTYNELIGVRLSYAHMIIIDEIEDTKKLNRFLISISPEMDRCYRTKVVMANSVYNKNDDYNYFQELWESGDWDNYLLHYKKNPYWTYKRLKSVLNRSPKIEWYEKMECVFVNSRNRLKLASSDIEITPHLSKDIKNKVNELTKQLNG